MKSFLNAIAAAILLGCGLLAVPTAHAADQYFLLNTSASSNYSSQSSPSNVMAYVQQKFGAASAASDLKVGVAVIYSPGNTTSSTPDTQVRQTLALLTNDLAVAKRLNIPILIQVDTENWLPTALLNWYDPAKPGYNTNKTADVEWTGWSPTNAVKLCWRNWGTQLRVGPQPNLLGSNFQAWEKYIYTNFIPPVLQWYGSLSATQKWLFVGWKCGWETSLNGQYYYYSNGNSYYSQPAANDPTSGPKQTMGYNAAQTAGFKTNGVLDFSGASANDYDINMKIIGTHLSYLGSLACSNGIPREKVFLHSIAEGVDRYNTDKLLNPFANPGATAYPGGSGGALKYNASFMRMLRTGQALCGATGYGYGEMNLFTTNYAPWFDWFTNALHGDPGCVFQALYNYDSMRGKPNVEQAMLDALALYPQTYDVTYNGNGSTIGVVPRDINSPYAPGAAVTVLASGKLARPSYVFTGWNTATDGTGMASGPGAMFAIGADVTLYAQWAPPVLAWSASGPKVVLNWPAGQGCQLQSQTNTANKGLGTNWTVLPAATPPYTNAINPANGAVFHRLRQSADALGTNLVIYGDALASGWTMNGFSSTANPANPSPVHSGTASISFTLTNGGGRGPFGPAMSTTNYNYLSFWIHGGTTGGQGLSLTALRSGSIVETWYVPTVRANTWVNYVLPLSLLKLSSVPDFNGFRFVNNLTGLDAPVFHVDDVQLQP
jgi:uncharacterized repeat protein (TIGR02543 family)